VTPALGDLLELLHGAERPFTTIAVTWRIWRHRERATEAWRSHIEQERRRGASISSPGLSTGEERPPEQVEYLRIWCDGDRVREQREGGDRDGSCAVRDGETWWMWDELSGVHTNAGDTSVGTSVGEETDDLLDPTRLLSSLRWEPVGRGEVAGRPTVTALARPRLRDPRHGRDSFALSSLGLGADHYRIEVDAEHGVLLEVAAVVAGEPFQVTSAAEISFDEPIDPGRFRFVVPEGEEVQDFADRFRHHRQLTVIEAQREAPFTVFVPARLPEDWTVDCFLLEPRTRPPTPWCVSLHYHSDDGHEQFSLTEHPAGDRPQQYATMELELREVDGTPLRVNDGRGQAQVIVERDGTFVFLMSDTVALDRLVTLATGLKPAPDSSAL
jgi:outer membrane lipoprotein-sorting protein